MILYLDQLNILYYLLKFLHYLILSLQNLNLYKIHLFFDSNLLNYQLCLNIYLNYIMFLNFKTQTLLNYYFLNYKMFYLFFIIIINIINCSIIKIFICFYLL